jgi:hypothetical protein
MFRSKRFLVLGVVFPLMLSLSGCSKENTSGVSSQSSGVNVSNPTSEDIPSELKHDAFRYYGLSNLKSVEMERRGGGPSISGGRVVRLTGIVDGKALYDIDNTGGLEAMPDEKLSVEKDGIYTVGLSGGTMTPARNLSLPADLTPGKTWPNKTTLKMDSGQTLVADHTYKVVGEQKVKTKAGEFDALLVEAGGPTEQNGMKMQAQMKIWLVKDVGPVKMEMTMNVNGKPVTHIIEATKVNK